MHISYAHAVRGIFPDDAGSPLNHVFKLQMAMTEEEEHATTLLGLVELLKNGTVCFVDPGSTKFPDACLQAYEDAGIRVMLGECVTDRDAPFPLPRYAASEAVDRTRRVPQEVARPAERAGARVGDAVLRRDVQRRSAARAQAAGRRAPHLAHAAPRQRRQGAQRLPAAGRGPVRRSTSSRSGCSDRTWCWPTCSASTTPRSTRWPAPAPRRPCARSPRPRARAASASTDGCPSCWPRASRWRSAATRPTTRTTWTSCAR